MAIPEYVNGIKDGNTVVPICDSTARVGIIANTQLIADTVGWSGKNQLENVLTSQTLSEVAITVNDDKTVNLNGTASANITSLFINAHVNLKAGRYYLSGNPEGITGNEYGLRISNADYSINTFFEQGKVLELEQDATDLRVDIRVPSGTVCNNTLFKPMIRKADILDSTYEPYRDTTAFPRDEQAVLGAKNLLRVKNTTNTSTMTQVRNADDSVTLNGTNTEASGLVAFTLRNDNNFFLPKGSYRLLVKTDKAYTGRIVTNVNATIGGSGVLLGSGDCNTPFEFEVASDSYPLGVYLSPYNNSACDNVTFYALLTLATDTNTVYQKPTFTNRELTEKIGRVIAKDLTSSDDLDNIKDIGLYDIRTTPSHAPENVSYCSMFVTPLSLEGTGQVQQIIITPQAMYIRAFINSWSSWYKFTGTAI